MAAKKQFHKSHFTLGLGLRAACPWRSLCPQVPTQQSVQRPTTKHIVFFYDWTWKVTRSLKLTFSPLKKWWLWDYFPFGEGLFPGAKNLVFGDVNFHVCPFPGQVTSGFFAASAGRVSAWRVGFVYSTLKRNSWRTDWMTLQIQHFCLETLGYSSCLASLWWKDFSYARPRWQLGMDQPGRWNGHRENRHLFTRWVLLTTFPFFPPKHCK